MCLHTRMRVEVHSRNAEVTLAIQSLIEKKAAKLSIFLPDDTIVRFMIDANKASRESPAPVGKRQGGLRTQDAVYDPAPVRHTRQDAAGKSWR